MSRKNKIALRFYFMGRRVEHDLFTAWYLFRNDLNR